MFPASEKPEVCPPEVPVQYGTGAMCVWLDPVELRSALKVTKFVLNGIQRGHPARILIPFHVPDTTTIRSSCPPGANDMDWAGFWELIFGFVRMQAITHGHVSIALTAGDLGTSAAWFEADPEFGERTLAFQRHWLVRISAEALYQS